jgi:hypothetical protein
VCRVTIRFAYVEPLNIMAARKPGIPEALARGVARSSLIPRTAMPKVVAAETFLEALTTCVRWHQKATSVTFKRPWGRHPYYRVVKILQ